MSKRSYFSQYESPNIVIVPTVSFYNVPERKKKRLITECRVDGTSERIETSSSNLENSSTLIESGKTKDNDLTILRNKHSLKAKNISHEMPTIKRNSLERGSEKVAKVTKSKKKPSACKEISKQINISDKMDKIDVSEPTSFKKDLGLTTAKNIAKSEKYKLPENLSKNLCNKIKKAINNSDRTPLKRTDNQYNISSIRKDKPHFKHDHTSKHNSLRNLSSNESQHADKYTDSKVIKNTVETPTEVIKYDSHDKSNNFKSLDRGRKKEQQCKKACNDKSSLKSKSKNIYSDEIILKCDTNTNHCSTANDCFKTNDTKKDHKRDSTNKYKHETQIHNDIKQDYISTSQNKKHTNSKDNLTDQIKGKIEKKSDANKYDTKTINIKKSHNNDRCKNKVESTNKSEHDNKKQKLKLLKIDNATKKSTKEKKHTENSISSCRKSSPENVYENLTVTVETQSEKLENSELPKTKNLNKPNELNLIINVVVKNADNNHNMKIANEDTSTSNTEDLTPSVSNSELSFLDDINIDEIVESLRQPTLETDVIQQESRDPNKPSYESIIIIDESDTEENIFSNENVELNSNEVSAKIEKYNESSDENNINNKIVNITHFSNNKINLLEERDQVPGAINPTLLSVENITKQKIIEEKVKITTIDITAEDDKIEALSDCSTVVLDELDLSDIEECDDIPEKKENTLVLNVTDSSLYLTKSEKNDDYVKCSINQPEEIVLPERALGTTTLKDPIEAQLNKMFEMYSSDTFDNDVDKSVSLIIHNRKEKENTPEDIQEIIASPHQIELLDAAQNKQFESQKNNINDGQRSLLNKTNNIIDTPVTINTNTKVVESHKPDITVSKPIKTVKSEIRKVKGKKPLPLTQEDKIIMETLEKRMLDFLKTQYTLTSVIHIGKHSKIYQCIDLGGFNYALKILNHARDRFSGVQKDYMLMDIQKEIPKEKLHCVYVLNGFSLYGHWCFLMEYYPTTLFEALRDHDKSFHIDTVQMLAKQLILAVTVLRNKNIVHSDIKPSHILINCQSDRIKLCGFDSAYYINDTTMAPSIGTPNYRPPEVILGYLSGFPMDVWSTGLVMYEMATNIKLFPGHYNNDILFKQQCTLGGIPYDMLEKCMFKENHFYENAFMRRIGFNREVIKYVYRFEKSNRIHRTLFCAYAQDWSEIRTEQERFKDMEKLADFQNLLDQMLVIHPKYRLSIEFVYANPFIYEYSKVPNS